MQDSVCPIGHFIYRKPRPLPSGKKPKFTSSDSNTVPVLNISIFFFSTVHSVGPPKVSLRIYSNHAASQFPYQAQRSQNCR